MPEVEISRTGEEAYVSDRRASIESDGGAPLATQEI
jgi:hypothetical protein